jgi:hypothetical protein
LLTRCLPTAERDPATFNEPSPNQCSFTIDIPSYGTFTLGDEVQVAGGFVLEHSSDDIEPGPFEVGGISVPAECAKHDIFLAH